MLTIFLNISQFPISWHHSTYTLHQHQYRISDSSTRDKYHFSKMLKIARHIELKLHSDSASFSDYIDISTLSQRITSLTSNMKEIRKIRNSNKNRTVDDTICELTVRFDSSLWMAQKRSKEYNVGAINKNHDVKKNVVNFIWMKLNQFLY